MQIEEFIRQTNEIVLSDAQKALQNCKNLEEIIFWKANLKKQLDLFAVVGEATWKSNLKSQLEEISEDESFEEKVINFMKELRQS